MRGIARTMSLPLPMTISGLATLATIVAVWVFRDPEIIPQLLMPGLDPGIHVFVLGKANRGTAAVASGSDAVLQTSYARASERLGFGSSTSSYFFSFPPRILNLIFVLYLFSIGSNPVR